MKELSIKEKAYNGNYKVYTELINRLEGVKDAIKKQNYGIAMDILCKPYPEFQVTTHSELKESEDEKVRKEIVTYLKSVIANKGYRDIIIESWIAWLEKQGEQKPDDIRTTGYWNVQEVEQKPAEKVEPKFKVGDWIVRNGETLQISGIDTVLDGTFHYWFTKGTWLSSKKMGNTMLWTIQDAKDGDVLSDGTTIFMFKDLLSDGSVISHCDYDTDTGESDAFCPLSVNLICSKITPATKEQRNQLEKAMADAGYTFDFEKKELKKIEQKPAWSEEDETKLKSACALIRNTLIRNTSLNGNKDIIDSTIDWLKSLKDRIQPKQEWSEEDRDYYDAIIAKLEVTQEDALLTGSQMEFLKSLKERYTWKPSDEQIKALEDSIEFLGCTKKVREDLKSLYEQLKKLREGKL